MGIRMFVGGGSEGIDTALFTPHAPMRLRAAARDGKIMYMLRQGNVLYALQMGDEESALAAYRCQTDGRLERMGEPFPTGGSEACHLTVSPCGGFLYCANYRSGSISEFRINRADGAIQARTQVIAHHGRSVNALRQEAAHAHMVCFTPDRLFLCVVDLGLDSIFLYRFVNGQGIEETAASVCTLPAGCGPRHMRFDTPSSALVIAEMKPLLGYLTYAEGKLTAVQYRTLSPALLSGAAIRLSGDLKTAYLSHRSNHSVTRIGLADGRCQTLEGVGLSPRDVNLTPDGRYAVCANEGGDMTVLTLTEETMRIVARIPCKGSNCVVFAEE